jgi:Ser/Thr protein kinase RdoA (MazF antagonist)
MQSISKTPLTHETLQGIVTHHFGSAGRLVAAEELTDGYYNAAYRLDLADGLRCVLKVAPPASVRVLRYEQDIMTAEVEAIRLVRAHTTMPAPEILCHDPSHRLIDNEFFVMAFVPGMPFHKVRASLSQEDQQRITRRIGAFLAEMNALSGPAFAYLAPRSPRFQDWRSAFDFMLRGVLSDGQEMSVELPLPMTRSSICCAGATRPWMQFSRPGSSTGICGTAMCSSIRPRRRSPASSTSSGRCGAIR